MLTVTKFGGSSLANSEQFKKVKSIIASNENRKIVIVSAIGKRNSKDSKITDLLFLLHAHLKYSVSYKNILDMIKERYYEVHRNLGLKYDITEDFAQLEKNLSKGTQEDYLVSRGEYFSAKLMADYLGFTFVDASDVIKFNYNGKIDYDECENKITEAYEKYGPIVIPGFYGSYPNMVIKLLSRGGSDITGSIVARSLKAAMYENWTDVSGFLMADPKIIKNPKIIKQITYSELRELSYMGANVLHEETVIPVQETNIPINILNTNSPSDPGTIITQYCDDNNQIITGITGRKNFTSFTITKSYSANKTLTINTVLNVFEKYHVKVEHIPTGIDSFSVVTASSDVDKCLYDLINDIKHIPDIENIKTESDIALVSVVGRNMATKAGIAGKLFGTLGQNAINIKMIAQGAQEINIIIGVKNNDFEKTIKAIYENCAMLNDIFK